MNKLNFDFDSFDNGILAVNCMTKESAINFLEFLDDNDYVWSSGIPLVNETYWNTHESNSCYSSYGHDVMFSNTGFYESEDYKIARWEVIVMGYTTSEMFKELEKDPQLQFKTNINGFTGVMSVDDDYFQLNIYDINGVLISESVGAGGFNGNLKTNQIWTLVEESLSFMDAVNSGKKFKHIYWDSYYDLKEVLAMLSKTPRLNVVTDILNKNEWAVEE